MGLTFPPPYKIFVLENLCLPELIAGKTISLSPPSPWPDPPEPRSRQLPTHAKDLQCIFVILDPWEHMSFL